MRGDALSGVGRETGDCNQQQLPGIQSVRICMDHLILCDVNRTLDFPARLTPCFLTSLHPLYPALEGRGCYAMLNKYIVLYRGLRAIGFLVTYVRPDRKLMVILALWIPRCYNR